MSRKKKPVAPPDKPSSDWLLTFSDLLTLLITMFVLLISMSSMDTQKLKDVFGFFTGAVAALETGRGQPGRIKQRVSNGKEGEATLPADLLDTSSSLSATELQELLQAIFGVSEDLVARLRRVRAPRDEAEGLHAIDALTLELLAGSRPIVVRRYDDRSEVGVHLGLLFAEGQAVLREESKPLVEELRRLARGSVVVRRVEVSPRERGQTPDTFSPWDLAGRRAAVVAEALQTPTVPLASVASGGRDGRYARVLVAPRARPSARELVGEGPGD